MAADAARDDVLVQGIVPLARDRMMGPIEREQRPGDVRMTLAGALSGDITRQQFLFQAMAGTWPMLRKSPGSR